MELIIEDINLVDDATNKGGVAFEGETLGDFIGTDLDDDTFTLADINKHLVECGIEPITLEQIRIIGKVGE